MKKGSSKTKEEKIKHILRTQQFNRLWLEDLFSETNKIMSLGDEGRQYLLPRILQGKRILLLFMPDSLRTRVSFHIAAQNLGATVLDIVSNGGFSVFSSEIEGDNFEDFILTFAAKSDCLVIRYNKSNYAERAAGFIERAKFNVSVINAGDKNSQHPTQALVDIYSIYKEFGRLDDLSGLIMGDCWGSRAVHSLVYLLSKFKIKSIYFVSPPRSGIPEDIARHLKEKKIRFDELRIDNIDLLKGKLDFIYTVGLPKQLPSTKDRVFIEKAFRIDKRFINEYLGEKGRIFHPRPRGEEIVCWRMDDLKAQKESPDFMIQAAYMRQAEYEDYVRMALYKILLNPDII